MTGQVLKAALDAVRTRLSAHFNATMAAVAAEYGVAAPIAIDFSAQSRQFFQGNLDPDSVTQSSIAGYPLMMVYAEAARNQNDRQAALFAGLVDVSIQLHLSWREGNAVRNCEALSNAAGDALIRLFNAMDWGLFGPPCYYNGQCALRKSRIEAGGRHWRQTIVFTMALGVDTD